VVNAHYESQLHGGSFPVDPVDGRVWEHEGTGRPYLEGQLVPGVELLRAVCYSLQSVDMWCMAVQAAYNVRADGSGGVSERQRALVREVYAALDAPLDERFRMLHPWLEEERLKADDARSRPFGKRGRWVE
tara:strand:- start:3 stop:395 length:393 start_codon:yes stop_codon:yes gene_type:complete